MALRSKTIRAITFTSIIAVTYTLTSNVSLRAAAPHQQKYLLAPIRECFKKCENRDCECIPSSTSSSPESEEGDNPQEW